MYLRTFIAFWNLLNDVVINLLVIITAHINNMYNTKYVVSEF